MAGYHTEVSFTLQLPAPTQSCVSTCSSVLDAVEACEENRNCVPEGATNHIKGLNTDVEEVFEEFTLTLPHVEMTSECQEYSCSVEGDIGGEWQEGRVVLAAAAGVGSDGDTDSDDDEEQEELSEASSEGSTVTQIYNGSVEQVEFFQSHLVWYSSSWWSSEWRQFQVLQK